MEYPGPHEKRWLRRRRVRRAFRTAAALVLTVAIAAALGLLITGTPLNL